jgi:hypothetical protein
MIIPRQRKATSTSLLFIVFSFASFYISRSSIDLNGTGTLLRTGRLPQGIAGGGRKTMSFKLPGRIHAGGFCSPATKFLKMHQQDNYMQIGA